jgi:hypothetical protein
MFCFRHSCCDNILPSMKYNIMTNLNSIRLKKSINETASIAGERNE